MKIKTITYWISTVCFCGFMAFTAYNYFIHSPKMVAAFDSLGYPRYLMNLLGIAKTLGVVALLVPGFLRLKEWPYAGFVFVLVGATWSHLAANQTSAIIMPLASVVLLILSYSCRPLNRKIHLLATNNG